MPTPLVMYPAFRYTKRMVSVRATSSYYDVDRGVEPDHIIDSYEHFYDREALTKYINSLY